MAQLHGSAPHFPSEWPRDGQGRACLLYTSFRVDMRVRHEVTAIHPAEKTVDVRNLATGETFTESYDKPVLSPGARPTQPALPGVGTGSYTHLSSRRDT